MARYLLQSRIEEIPFRLAPDDTSFLKERIDTIEKEAACIKTQIAKLNHQLKSKRKELAAIHNILAPIRLLPFEILSEIFYEYVGNSRDARLRLLLTHVCLAWRRVAHGTSKLWTGLELLNSRGFKSFMEHGEMMVDWLSRSGTLPLNVSVGQGCVEDPLHLKNLLDNLVPFCSRLQSLTLTFPFRALTSQQGAFLALGECPFPALKKLDLDIDDIRGYWVKKFACRRFTTFINAPLLNDVKLRLGGEACIKENPVSILLDTLPIPVNQLHSIHLEFRHYPVDPRSYLDLLKSCSALVECRLLCVGWLRGPLAELLPMTFPTLRILSLEQWDDPSESRFIQLITVPSLDTFRIDHSIYSGDDPSDLSTHLINLQARSSSSLSTFELIRVRLMSTEEILSVIAEFPALEHLKLCDCNLNTQSLMYALALPGDRLPLVPNLESLYLVDYEVIPKGSESFIADMVETRTASVAGRGKVCLRALRLAYRRQQLSETMINRFREVLDFHMDEDCD
ncbi:hypothetical protein BDP27DRAFT_1038976 [Rhodocollybia butyracea]|uniref:F-box domain-containing protein n=1 Tax=Rhodocollybia butyracea TaxID=206335 RepID=A0A9P5Q685_9AGAR|nr:hypothetical protein BDP27DRAFT_1038976 [Rhodocollybia butyracea]